MSEMDHFRHFDDAPRESASVPDSCHGGGREHWPKHANRVVWRRSNYPGSGKLALQLG